VSLTDNASKDDEERRLESLLFGVPFVPSDKDIFVVSDGKEGAEEFGEGVKELENMLDTDVSSHWNSSNSRGTKATQTALLCG
jgi:U3 small nucleolar RNA-associated protein 18